MLSGINLEARVYIKYHIYKPLFEATAIKTTWNSTETGGHSASGSNINESKYFKFTIKRNDVPVNWLVYKYNCSNTRRCPNSEGILPKSIMERDMLRDELDHSAAHFSKYGSQTERRTRQTVVAESEHC